MTDLRDLSIHHCPRGRWPPPVPTNEERYRRWRDCQPVQLHNAYKWAHLNFTTPANTSAKESK